MMRGHLQHIITPMQGREDTVTLAYPVKGRITPARYDEGTLATNHNATTGERGYHNMNLPLV